MAVWSYFRVPVKRLTLALLAFGVLFSLMPQDAEAHTQRGHAFKNRAHKHWVNDNRRFNRKAHKRFHRRQARRWVRNHPRRANRFYQRSCNRAVNRRIAQRRWSRY